MAGADVVMSTSAVLQQGPAFFTRTLAEMTAWLEQKGYSSVGQLRGCMSQRAVPDSAAFVRGNYIKDSRELCEGTSLRADGRADQSRARMVSPRRLAGEQSPSSPPRESAWRPQTAGPRPRPRVRWARSEQGVDRRRCSR